MSLLRFLRKTTKNYPVAVEMMQVSVIMGSGDVLAQTLGEKKRLNELNLKRTAKFAALGLCFVGPSLRIWYTTIERRIAQNQSPLRRTLKKVALDQGCFAPVFIVAITSVMSTLDGMGVDQTVARVQRDFWPILKTNYMLWPAAQLINFGLVPLRYQVIFAQCVALAWNVYLSLMLNAKSTE